MTDGRYDPGILTGRVEGDTIRINVDGGDWQRKEVAEVITTRKLLTVLPKKTKDGTGELSLPLTWAVVTQLARLAEQHNFRWRPDEGLALWIRAEFERRFTEFSGNASDLKFDVSSLPRVPMKHQLSGAYTGALMKRFFFGDAAGPQPVTTPVLTPSGWTELGKLSPGDYVYSVDGEPTRIEEVKFLGQQPVYRVTFKDRTSTLATGSHRWTVYSNSDRSRRESRPRPGRVMSTEELIASGLTRGVKGGYEAAKWFLPQQPVISDGVPQGELPLDAYLYGALLGDGSLTGTSLYFTSGDRELLEAVRYRAEAHGTTVKDAVSFKGTCPGIRFQRDGSVWHATEVLDMRHRAEDKYVHPGYLAGDEAVRREVLRGLLDTDGYCGNARGTEFVSVSRQLAADVAFLARSLGATATQSAPQPSYLSGERKQDKYRVHLRFPASAPNPFRLTRKARAWAATGIQRKNPPRAFAAIEPEGEAEVCCIRVKHSAHVYLTDTALIPTHNTGKTFTALLTLAELDAQGLDPFPAFVVTPASVVDPWLEELQACFPDWAFTAYRGAKRQGLSTRYQVYVTSWDVFRRDMFPADLGECDRCGDRIAWTRAHQKAAEDAVKGIKGAQMPRHENCPKGIPSRNYGVYRPIEADKHVLPPLLDFVVPRTVVMDEAHALCNVKTKQSMAAVRIARVVPYVFPMSGTPIINDVSGFWTAMRVMDTRSFPDQDRYQARYTDRYQRDYGRPEVTGLTTVNREEFYTVIQGAMRRVAKRDVLDLPPKTYSTRVVDIPPAYRAAYDEMEADMIAHIPDTDEPLPVMSTLAQMQRLAQLASAACDVEIEYVLDEKEDSPTRGEMIPHYKVTMREPSWKVDDLMQLLSESSGEPVITFAPYTQLIKLAGARAEKEGLRVGYIVGGQTSRQRTKTRLAFQEGEIDLLCANTSAGGVGLTLTRSSTVVFLQRPWSYWRGDQSEDRADRFGQTRPVSVIDIVARNTIEARVREVCKDKAQQLSDLVRDPRIVREFLGGERIRV